MTRRGYRYDVVFHSPFLGWSLLSNAPGPPGGAETQVLRLARALARRGASVAIIAFGDADTPSELDGLHIIKLAPYSNKWGFASRVTGALRLWRALWSAPSPVVVHRCAGPELGVIALFTRMAGRNLVYSAANIIDFDPSRLIRRRLDRFLYRLGVLLADEIVAQTEEQVPRCQDAFGRTPVVIKSIVEPCVRSAAAPEAFLWVGRLVWYKRPRDYLALAHALSDARFWMVAVPALSPPEEQAFGKQVLSEARAIPNLEVLDPQPQREIERLMDRAVASVNTAEFEGMPNVLLEAWCRGVPGLVLRHDPDGVVDRYGLGGFAGGSMQRFIQLAAELWISREARVELAQRCQRYVHLNHSAEAVTTQWQEVLASHGTKVTATARAEPAAPG